jgi:aromatic-L-amino-acid decarboxylase
MFALLMDSSPYFEFVAPPSFALTVFRLIEPQRDLPGSPPSRLSDPAIRDVVSATSINALNKLFYARLSARDDIVLTQTVLTDVFCIRLAVGSARTDESHIRRVFNVLQEEGRETLMLAKKA